MYIVTDFLCNLLITCFLPTQCSIGDRRTEDETSNMSENNEDGAQGGHGPPLLLEPLVQSEAVEDPPEPFGRDWNMMSRFTIFLNRIKLRASTTGDWKLKSSKMKTMAVTLSR